MTKVQAKLYRETMQRSRKVLEEFDDDVLDAAAAEDETETVKKPAAMVKAKKGAKKKVEEKKSTNSSSHILMDLRKAASHPLLFRRLYTDAKVKQIAKECLNTPKWCDSVFELVVEDLEVSRDCVCGGSRAKWRSQIMSDAELHHFCEESDFDNLRKFALSPDAFLEGGKVKALQKHIIRCQKEGKRMLLFSQVSYPPFSNAVSS